MPLVTIRYKYCDNDNIRAVRYSLHSERRLTGDEILKIIYDDGAMLSQYPVVRYSCQEAVEIEKVDEQFEPCSVDELPDMLFILDRGELSNSYQYVKYLLKSGDNTPLVKSLNVLVEITSKEACRYYEEARDQEASFDLTSVTIKKAIFNYFKKKYGHLNTKTPFKPDIEELTEPDCDGNVQNHIRITIDVEPKSSDHMVDSSVFKQSIDTFIKFKQDSIPLLVDEIDRINASIGPVHGTFNFFRYFAELPYSLIKESTINSYDSKDALVKLIFHNHFEQYVRLINPNQNKLNKFEKPMILFYGPAGNGKTHTSKELLDPIELNKLFYGAASSLNKSLVGQTEELINSWNKIALKRIYQLHLVMIDEVHTIAKDQSKTMASGSEHKADAMGSLLKSLENQDAYNVIFVAATNYKNSLDEAFVRRGRFNNKYLITSPTNGERWKLISENMGDLFAPLRIEDPILMASVNFSHKLAIDLGSKLKKMINQISNSQEIDYIFKPLDYKKDLNNSSFQKQQLPRTSFTIQGCSSKVFKQIDSEMRKLIEDYKLNYTSYFLNVLSMARAMNSAERWRLLIFRGAELAKYLEETKRIKFITDNPIESYMDIYALQLVMKPTYLYHIEMNFTRINKDKMTEAIDDLLESCKTCADSSTHPVKFLFVVEMDAISQVVINGITDTSGINESMTLNRTLGTNYSYGTNQSTTNSYSYGTNSNSTHSFTSGVKDQPGTSSSSSSRGTSETWTNSNTYGSSENWGKSDSHGYGSTQGTNQSRSIQSNRVDATIAAQILDRTGKTDLMGIVRWVFIYKPTNVFSNEMKGPEFSPLPQFVHIMKNIHEIQ